MLRKHCIFKRNEVHGAPILPKYLPKVKVKITVRHANGFGEIGHLLDECTHSPKFRFLPREIVNVAVPENSIVVF